MTAYAFDADAATFHFFLLTMALAAAAFATWRVFVRQVGVEREPTCAAPEAAAKAARVSRPAGPSRYGIVSVAVLWVLVAWAARGAMNARAPTLYDPFEVLGVSSGASEDDIKAAFKRLSRIHHPDKVDEAERDAAEARFVEIGKAYRALTDADTRRNWEEHGNPDGVRTFALGVALPAWLVSSPWSSVLLVAVYALVFGLVLPLSLRRWWARHRRATPGGVRQDTMYTLYTELRDGYTPRRVLEALALAGEVDHTSIPALANEDALVAAVLERIREQTGEAAGGMPRRFLDGGASRSARRAFALLYAHVRRVPLGCDALEDVQRTVVGQAYLVLTSGVLTITKTRDYFQTTLAAMSLAQYLVAALWEGDSPLLQLPYVAAADLETSPALRKVASVSALMDMAEDARRALFGRLSDGEYAELLAVAASFPEVRATRVRFAVLGQDAITPGGIVTCRVTLSVEYPALDSSPDALAPVENEATEPMDDEDEGIELDEDGGLAEETSSRATKLAISAARPPPVYCPRFPLVKRPAWWLCLVNRSNNGFVVDPVRITDLADTKTLSMQFAAPPKAMAVSMQLAVRADWGVGAGFTRDVRFVVSEPAAASAKASDSEDPWGLSGDEDDRQLSFAE